MRTPCRLLLFALSLVCLNVARADQTDYTANILDPAAAAGTSFTVYTETTDTFSVTLDACQANELPGGNTGDGCFAISNRSGDTWTSLTLNIPNTAVLGSQDAACQTDTTALAFQNTTMCGLDPTGAAYTLDFVDGAFASGTSNTLFIVESGVPYDEFPTFTATAGTSGTSSVTPEPSSWLLLASGALAGGLLYRRRLFAV